MWDGADGTAADDALAACGTDAIAAAYSLDAQTGAWSRWFAGKPEVSTLPPLNDLQGVLAFGSATGPAPTTTVTPGAGVPEVGTYSGTTSEGKPFFLQVTEGSEGGRAVTQVEYGYEGTCGADCTCGGDHLGLNGSFAIVDNAFSYSGTLEISISGTFDSTTTASGTFRIHREAFGSDKGCDSGEVTWTASLQ